MPSEDIVRLVKYFRWPAKLLLACHKCGSKYAVFLQDRDRNDFLSMLFNLEGFLQHRPNGKYYTRYCRNYESVQTQGKVLRLTK